MPPPSSAAGVWLMLIALAALWGLSFVFGKILLEAFPVLLLVWLRIGIAAVAMIVFALVARRLPPLRREVLIAFFAMGTLNSAFPFSLILWGQPYIGVGEAAILVGITPFLTALLGAAFTADERVNRRQASGIAIGFIGIVLIASPNLGLAPQGDFPFVVVIAAQICMIATAISYAVANIFGRRFRRMGVSSAFAAGGQVIGSWLAISIAVGVHMLINRFGGFPDPYLAFDWNAPTFEQWATLIFFGVFSTSIAYFLYFSILAQAGAVHVSLVGPMVPVAATLGGFLLLGEIPAGIQFFGAAVVIGGLTVFNGLPGRPKPSATPSPP